MSGLAEEEFERPAWVIWAKRGAGAVVALALAAGLWRLAMELMKPTSGPQRQTARIAIVPNTPPPPPPPKEEKKVEQKENKPVNVEQVKAAPQPPDQQIKMEGQGSDTGLAGIGAGPVTNDYAGQKIGGGEPGGNRFAWYKTVIQQLVQSALQKNARLRTSNYRVIVKIWLSPDGTVSRAELTDTTGSADMDERLRTALSQLPPLGERPPEGLPQPITMRLTTRS